MNQLITNHASSAFVQKYGPWALVTGASDGIGRAMAREAAQRGLNVVLVARRQAELSSLANELAQAHGILTRVLVADLGTHEGVPAVQQGCADLDVDLVVTCEPF